MTKTTKQQSSKKSWLVSGIATSVFVAALVLSIIGLSTSVREISENMVAGTPDAILASVNVDDGKDVSLAVAYFDQKSDECVNIYDTSKRDGLESRQFEWISCGYLNKDIEQGLVDFYLGEDYLPKAQSGQLIANRGIGDMKRWFSAVDGKSKNYNGTIKLSYERDGAEFSFNDSSFYPLDDVKFSNGDAVNKDGHNHLFTMNFAVPFTVLGSGNESFEITADDDTFVFVGKELALDMGGVHDAMTGKITIRKNGEIYTAIGDEELAYSGINVAVGSDSIIRIFHADRDSDDSVFGVKFSEMNLNIVETRIADSDEIQIAYDPSDPSYVAPLGESSVVKPDTTKGYITMATIFGVIIAISGALVILMMRSTIKQKLIK